MAREEFSGNAVPTTLASTISSGSSTLQLADSSGWPTGSTFPFVATIDRNTVSEEKILVSNRTGSILTIATRGYDGTTALTHSSGAAIEHTVSAAKMAILDAHVGDPTRDDHPQYQKVSQKAAASGYASLDSSTKVPIAQIPTGATGSTVPFGNDARLSDTRTPTDNTVSTPKLVDDAVTYAKMQNASATDRLLGRDTAGVGNYEELTVGGGLEFTGAAGIQTSAFTGDVTKPAGSTATTLAAGSISAVSKFASGLRPVQIVTSSTRPASPSIGDPIFETDTGKLLLWYGGSWVAATNGAFGRIGDAIAVADGLVANGSGNFATPLSATVVVLASRRIKVTFSCRGMTSSVGGDSIELRLFKDGAQVAGQGTYIPVNDALVPSSFIFEDDNPTAGTHIYAIYASRTFGSGIGGYKAASGYPATLLVEDIGAH